MENKVILISIDGMRPDGLKNCKKSTWAEMVAEDAIKEWNEGHLECELPDITIE